MTGKDYMRLAKESLASRKKNTRSTVRGIAVGLIFLIPVLFIALGVYVELTSNVNKSPEMLGLNLTASVRGGLTPQAYSYSRGSDSYENKYLVLTSNNLDDVAGNVDGDTYYYEQIHSAQSYTLLSDAESGAYGNAAFDFTANGVQKSYVYNQSTGGPNQNNMSTNFAAILDMEKSGINGQFNPEKIAGRYDGSIYLSGYDKGFSDGGKGQVIVSELFLEKLGLTTGVYENKISLSYTDGASSGWYQFYIDNDSSPDNNDYDSSMSLAGNTRNVKLFNEYEVVGIIKKKVSEDAQLAASDSPIFNLLANPVFLTAASRGSVPGTALEPVINTYADSNNSRSKVSVATYTDGFDTLNQEYLGLGATDFTSVSRVFIESNNQGETYAYTPQETLLVDAESFSQLDKIVNQTATALSSLLGDNPRDYVSSSFASSIYYMMSMIFTVFSYVILVLAIFGGIVFFAAIVNLYNSIAHSVDSRKHYLGVMRAIGARGSTIAKMYLAESLTIFRRASLWIIIFAGGVCFGLWFLINWLFSYTNEMMVAIFGAEFTVSAVFIPIAIVASLAVLVVIGIVFSYALSRRVATRPITEILLD